MARLDRAKQADFLEFSEIRLNVVKGLIHIYCVVHGNPIRQFLCCLTLLEKLPQAFTERIERVDRVKVPHAPANRNNNRLASNFAGDDGRIAGQADRCRIYRRG